MNPESLNGRISLLTVHRKMKRPAGIRRFQILNPFMKTANKTWSILLLALLLAFPVRAQQQPASQQRNRAFDSWDPTDEGMKSGPAVGETIPGFEALDQNGRPVRFQDIAGPNGAVILFHRSADW
jgi:hypothetical protein